VSSANISVVTSVLLSSTPAHAGNSLNLLAMAAGKYGSLPIDPKLVVSSRASTTRQGTLPAKLAKRILDLDFVDIAKIGCDSDIQHANQTSQKLNL